MMIAAAAFLGSFLGGSLAIVLLVTVLAHLDDRKK